MAFQFLNVTSHIPVLRQLIKHGYPTNQNVRFMTKSLSKFLIVLFFLQGYTNGNDYETHKNGSGFHLKPGPERKHSCTHKKNRLIVDQEYEMKPMLGVRSSKLLEKEPTHSSKERLGNGDLNKYKSVSMDNASTEVVGRFINVTQLTDMPSADDNENVHIRTIPETVVEDDVCDDDLTEEAPQHKLSVATKSSCSDCKPEFNHSKCADLEERFQEMSSNMQRLESRMETLIALLERNGNYNAPPNQERVHSGDVTQPNCTVTSV